MKVFPCLLIVSLLCLFSIVDVAASNITAASLRGFSVGDKREKEYHKSSFIQNNRALKKGKRPKKEQTKEQSSQIFEPRIFGGSRVQVGEYPYLAAIFNRGDWNSIYFKCGGVLLAPDIVLTAAHCAPVADVVMTPLYHLDISKPVNEKLNQPTARHFVEKIVTHPDYDEWTLNNDVCILKLAKDPSWSQNDQNSESETTFYPSIELNFDSDIPERNAEMHVTGWGTTETEIHTMKPLDTIVLAMRNKKCSKLFTSTFTNSMMCGASPPDQKNDACSGDSGGPLVIKGGGRKGLDLLVGTVSWGITCADSKYPGVYTKMSELGGWIQRVACGSTDVRDYCVNDGKALPVRPKNKNRNKNNNT